MGRESTAFRGLPTYSGLKDAVQSNSIAYTVEFHPEEGKYHFNGHRKCGVSQPPSQTLEQASAACPSCGRPMTLGVLHRMLSLSEQVRAGVGSGLVPDADGLIRHPDGRPPFMRLVPLAELLGEALGVGPRTKVVQRVHRRLCEELGSELEVLARANEFDLVHVAGELVAEAILKVRSGQVTVEPGYDGKYGTVRVNSTGQGVVAEGDR